MSKIIISGVTEYNSILKSSSDIRSSITDDDSSNNLNIVSTTELNGGSGANIAYNLAQLGDNPILLTSIGTDFNFTDFIKGSVDLKYINKSIDTLTGKKTIIFDDSGKKIVSTFKGASREIFDIDYNIPKGVEYGIVTASDAMIEHIQNFSERGLKTIFDPGSYTTNLTKEQIDNCVKYTDYLIVNTINYDVIKTIGQFTDEEMLSSFEKIIITYDLKGSKVFGSDYTMHEIPGVENPNIIDNVGASDAYRAGLLKGLAEGFSFDQSAKMGAILSSISTGSKGAQSHKIEWEEFERLYTETYGEDM